MLERMAHKRPYRKIPIRSRHAGREIAATDETAPEMTDDEVRAILTQAMADAGATPAAVYAFHKTGVVLMVDNERRISPERLRAWNDAIDEYNSLVTSRNALV
jgi:hypothetical protein